MDPGTASALADATPRRPYSVLLPVGFAVPPALPQARCALTAPFHPYRFLRASGERWERRSVLCGTVPRVTPAGRYPAPYVHGARTFLPGGLSASAEAAVRPTDRLGMGCAEGHVKARCRAVSSGRFRRPTPLIDGVLKLLYKLVPPTNRQPAGSDKPSHKRNTYNHGTNICLPGCGIAS